MAKSKTSKDLSGGCLSLFGLPFLAAGLFLTGMYLSGYLKWLDARGWEEVPCWIESAELETSHGDSTTYQATARYRYEYDGRSYEGDRVSFQGGSDNMGSFQQNTHRELSRYVNGKPAQAERDPDRRGQKAFRCYVNPDDPAESVLYRTLRWPMQAVMAIFALTFPAVGAGLVFGGLIGVRIARGEARLRMAHPEEPWKWKKDWSGGSVPEVMGVWGRALFAYTAWSALVIFPLVLTAAMSGAFQEGMAAWLLMIFVALWCVPAWFSLKRIRHRMAVGVTRFVPDRMPSWPGGNLEGNIVLKSPLPMRHVAEVSLACEKKVTVRRGKNTSTTTEELWSDSETVTNDRIVRGVSGFSLPVRFSLPADAPETDSETGASTRHLWKLRLEVPGTPVSSEFEVPVFRTKDSPVLDPSVDTRGNSILDEASGDLPALLAERRIIAEFDSNEMPVSLTCPPARHRSLIVFLIVFDLIWTAAAVFLVIQEAPLVFRIVWPLSSALIWVWVLWNLLHKRVVTFNPAELEVCNQLGPVVRTQVFRKQDISKFAYDSNMSSNNTAFYRVRLKSVPGQSKTLVDGITSTTTAGALVQRLDAWKNSAPG